MSLVGWELLGVRLLLVSPSWPPGAVQGINNADGSEACSRQGTLRRLLETVMELESVALHVSPQALLLGFGGPGS